ncbi:MAG TPA: multifunctional oxoglutarate decarboxylase/oxoglutarate dehydrogenase thiamine pyrophosphate-binding subunit/dihydrolipoyllysine-residue succinyltransferase subunit [Mycobacteriales bacterium]|nr:multifunctional oxoglutarate decarboxylase/oxoglutarate dehydrogenase thiamine pyrophosphate-binding subunit/dihydrolipoyllysine-residue succinyltransferase subunit [Mycobacteriales bacterium]
MSSQPGQQTDFGANEWLVYEMHQQYLKDPQSVPPVWRDFLSDYSPGEGDGGAGNGARSSAQESAAAQGQKAAPAQQAQAEAKKPSPEPAPNREPAAAKADSAPAAKKDDKPAHKPAAKKDENADKDGKDGASDGVKTDPLRGAAARVVSNMESSLEVPTATSVRSVPAKLLADNRIVINSHLKRSRGGKVSFTHLIGYALVRALDEVPAMNKAFTTVDGKPAVVTPDHVGLGLAIDLQNPNGTRSLVVAAIKNADTMDFSTYWAAYEDIVRRARGGKLTMEDFQGTTISLTNPGGIGTEHSVPRLMQGAGTIIGVGAMEYPAEFQGMSEETLARLAVSKTITLTSTYDHRVIQGAQSGEFLRRMHQLLLGEDGFYDEIFRSLRIPYVPVRWVPDQQHSHEGDLDKVTRVNELIHAYRVRGHLMADTDPLEFKVRSHPDLDVVNHGLSLWDLDREFPVAGFAANRPMKLRTILGVLRDSYCRTVGIEYMHIQDPDERRWLQARLEQKAQAPDREEQLHVLKRLNAAEAFENFLQTKYVGQKRFSLEGGETLIPLLDGVLQRAADEKLDEVAIAMPHRGRLNVLANIVGKSYAQIFREFEGNIDPRTAHGSGDVKYHLGAEGGFTSLAGNEVVVSLQANPSHLEAVNPVLEGVVRAKQDVINKGESGFTVLPVLLHGDAAFAGQGVVAETLQMAQLRGYRTGGTVHVVVNNQVGFTTGPHSARSSLYATDVARMVQAPIFHVNGDDPEACVRVAKLAFDYRQAFKKDVVIDMVCYRRRGHSEVDEPSFTQPLMYDTIDAKRSVRKIYTENLIGRGDITVEEAEAALRDYQEQLEKVFQGTREAKNAGPMRPEPEETGIDDLKTAISREVVKAIADSQVTLPEGFTPHPRLLPQLQKRAKMVDDGTIDWAMGETLAFGSLLLEGHPVRLAGQDARRGTFGHRHAVIVDRTNGKEHTPLASLSDDQAPYYVYDSLLSEFAAMGFEYGYSVARPDALVLWEAQFGDFVNGAMTIVDEFIAAGEVKWGQRSGVTLLLPHGYEGQGPDHSSARLERFLQLCAEDNMVVAAPTTPANYFHLLRRQALQSHKRPLVIMSPKSMLRLRAAASAVEAFTDAGFFPVLPDPDGPDPSAVRRVVLTTGKVHYDLLAARRKAEDESVALVRVEQLYPLPGEEIADALAGYPEAEDVVWVQEEPANQGPWSFIALNLPDHLPEGRTLRRVSRTASASPAAGSSKVHEAEQAALVAAALGTD